MRLTASLAKGGPNVVACDEPNPVRPGVRDMERDTLKNAGFMLGVSVGG